MNWRIRTSFRLFGTPQRKNNPVTRKKGKRWPEGRKDFPEGWLCAASVAAPVFDTSMSPVSLFQNTEPPTYQPQSSCYNLLLLHTVKSRFHNLQLAICMAGPA